MIDLEPTIDEVKTYREENKDVGITDARDRLRKQKMIKHLEDGGTAEPVLLLLLRDWKSEGRATVPKEE